MKNRVDIYIPFLDGLLNYDCKECGYGCCQSGNIILNIKEKRKLLKKYQFLRYFSTQETNQTYGIRKYPRCWFLGNNGLCSIQKEHGYSYKPFICKLCPFYVAKCNVGYVVVPEICPTLRVDRKKSNISHKQIFKNAREAIDCNNAQGEIDWNDKRLVLEKSILKGSKAFLSNSNYLGFAAYQISLATKNKGIAEIKTKLQDSVNLWKSFLGTDGLNFDNERLAYELTAITSLLRLESPLLSQMQAKDVPLALLALYFYMLLFTKTNKPRIYVQTHMQLLSDIALGLIFLEKDDLRLKSRPLEEKIALLRKLQLLGAVRNR